ncbi:type II toxin-antitoxin system SpoIISA family toxin [Halobacillus litoralis]|uniref:Uncharacterized protein n=1 Tax=Halobacillus litoralis TaxID=45668 RepID=A0A410MJ59_9BACI|nr:type II toxin-antitoxin system SpoIISA family toxin [Halobacillus litoralis]QAS54764.1 hypothetical protein HLI_21135 [Halobacillus litoralis]
MEEIQNLAPIIGLCIMLAYLVYIWTISSGHTWYYTLYRWIPRITKKSKDTLSKETKKRYRDNKRKFRRSLYALFIVILGIGYMLSVYTLENWQTLVTLAIVIIFADISVFSTPVIRKAGKFEFEQEQEINEYVEAYKKNELGLLMKVNKCTEQIQNAKEICGRIDNDLSYERSLEEFLQVYCDKFRINPYVYKIDANADDEYFLNALGETIDTIAHRHTINFSTMSASFNTEEDFNESAAKDKVFEMLFDAEFIEIERPNIERFIIIPIYTMDKTLIVVLQTDKGIIDNVDGPHITNLTYTFENTKEA